MTDWVFERLRTTKPSMFTGIAPIVESESVVNLTASKASSESLRNYYSKSNPIELYECACVPTFSDSGASDSDPPLVVNAASIQERKGTDLFVETAIKVCQSHPTVEFVWLGDGKRYGIWEELVKREHLEDRIRFSGHIDDPFSVIHRASVFFLSSRDDPFPLAVLEAMGLGKTIVAFDVGGVSEALSGNGILIQPFETDAAARAILDCLRKPFARLINAEVRKRYLDLYTPQRFAERLANILFQNLKR